MTIEAGAAPAWGRRFLLLGWLAAMVMVTILALLPSAYLQLPVFDWWDKAQHALAFAVLTIWAMWVWPHWLWRIALGMLLFGGAIEVAQWFTGWRYGEWADWAADAMGVLFASLAIGMVNRMTPRLDR